MMRKKDELEAYFLEAFKSYEEFMTMFNELKKDLLRNQKDHQLVKVKLPEAFTYLEQVENNT